MSLSVTLVLTATALILALVAWKGGEPERWGALLVGARHLLVDPLYHTLGGEPGFETVEPGHAMMDFALFLAMAWLALRANRFWPMCMCAAALITLLGHFVIIIGIVGKQRAYWAMTQLPLLLELVCLLAGTALHRARLKRLGPYRNWRRTTAAFPEKRKGHEQIR
ncbi:hypothetical protein [Erythrobacter sp. SG61-1L]|uniref:hypothetical protein n=1 Tax=Erythrobacter sp. SG61-1L TaxID=1603897 RepID=UPI0006C9328A|nr:hypothetical protein [Erythrobacter sp. SG61-1L]